MKIRKKFLQLTRHTFPYGTEHFLEPFLPQGYKTDKFGNYYISVGDNYTTMFTAHLDTSCKIMENVTHRFSGDLVSTDGTTILGADDKAGVVVMLYMIEKKIPGLYYFFIGEEVGCVGSSDLADELSVKRYIPNELLLVNKCISFDRRGTNSVITDQFYGTCCSDEFAKALCGELNKSGLLQMVPDDTGVLTDSAQFVGSISECTNISVGYYNEHTTSEYQDIGHLYKLCRSIDLVDWESLPVLRTPAKYSYGYGMCGWDGDWDDSPIDHSLSDYRSDVFTYIKKDDVKVKAYISLTWIAHEKLKIMEMLKSLNTEYTEIDWDGTSLWIKREDGDIEYIGARTDLINFIDTFKMIPVAHIRYEL